jgi:hypothetical protein
VDQSTFNRHGLASDRQAELVNQGGRAATAAYLRRYGAGFFAGNGNVGTFPG